MTIVRADASHVDGIMKLAEANYPERGGELTGTLNRNAVTATIQKMPSIVALRDSVVVGFLLAWEKGPSGNACVNAMLEAYSGSPDAYVYGPICVDASIGTIGVTSNRSHGVQGSVVRCSVSALSTSTRAMPPLPSAKP